MRTHWFALLIALSLLPLARGQGVAPPLSEQVVRDLASEDYAKRDAAQKALGEIGLNKMEELRGFAERMADPEVKARLMLRVEELGTQEAIEGPLITLDIRDANPGQLAEALGRAMGMRFAVDGGFPAGDARWNNSKLRFTLKVTNERFWNVIDQLGAQHGITLSSPRNDGNGSLLIVEEPNRKPGRYLGGFKVDTQVTMGMGFVAVERAGSGGAMIVHTITADPRLYVLDMKLYTDPDLIDDGRNRLSLAEGAELRSTAGQGEWRQELAIRGGVVPGSRIKSVRSLMTARIAVGMETVVVDHPAEHLKEPMKVGGKTFTITKFAESATRVDYVVESNGNDFEACWICLTDAKGMRFESAYAGHKTGTIVITGEGAKLNGPFKFGLSAPGRIQTVTLPVEWKDVPVPLKPDPRALERE